MDNRDVMVSGSGVVVASYDTVTFKTTVSDWAVTGPEAKNKIKEAAERVLAYVDALVAEGRAFNKVVSLTIDPRTDYQNQRTTHVGYTASLHVSFSSEQVAEALSVQERLTEFQQSKVESLAFGFKDVESLREKALENAWESVTRRFQHSADLIVGREGSVHYDPTEWTVDYDEFRPFSKTSAPTEDKPGMAQVVVSLRVTFAPSPR